VNQQHYMSTQSVLFLAFSYILRTDRLATDRPTDLSRLSFGGNSNGDISRRIVRFTPCLVLGWGFRGQRIEWRYFRFRQIQDGGGRHLGKFKWQYLRGGSSNPHRMRIGIRFMPCLVLGWGFRGRRIEWR